MASTNQSMFEIMEALNKRMEKFECELQKTPPSATSDSLAADYTAFKTFTLQLLRALQEQLTGLAISVDQQEMRSRRKIVLLHGVDELKDEVCTTAVTTIINQHLKIAEFKAECITRCQRMGRARQDKPRPLLVKFKDLTIRDKVWFSKTHLKGTGITLSEFLTKSRHTVFMAARQRFGIAKCWTREGYVHILTPDGTRHRLSSLVELQNIPSPTAESVKAGVTAATKELAAPRPRRAAAGTSRK